MTTKWDVLKFTTKPLIGGAIVVLYDVFAKGLKFKISLNSVSFNDGLIMASSILVSDLLTKIFVGEILQNLINFNGIEKNIAEPILNTLIYQYFFNTIIVNNFKGAIDRVMYETIFIGFASSILSNILENPLFGLLSNSKMI